MLKLVTVTWTQPPDVAVIVCIGNYKNRFWTIEKIIIHLQWSTSIRSYIIFWLPIQPLMLHPILNKIKCSFLIYKQIIRPILTHACPVREKYATSHLNKIRIFRNEVIRMIAIASWFIRITHLNKDLQTQELENLIKTLSKNVHRSLLNSSDSLIICHNLRVHSPQRRLKRGRPHDLN